MPIKNKKYFAQPRLVFFAEVPAFQDGEKVENKKTGEEKKEADPKDQVAAVNERVEKHADALAALPKEYSDQFHNKVQDFLQTSPESDPKAFAEYRAGMQTKAEDIMKKYGRPAAPGSPAPENPQTKKDA